MFNTSETTSYMHCHEIYLCKKNRNKTQINSVFHIENELAIFSIKKTQYMLFRMQLRKSESFNLTTGYYTSVLYS